MSSLENISEQRNGHYQFISNDRLQDVPTVRAITRSIEPAWHGEVRGVRSSEPKNLPTEKGRIKK